MQTDYTAAAEAWAAAAGDGVAVECIHSTDAAEVAAALEVRGRPDTFPALSCDVEQVSAARRAGVA